MAQYLTWLMLITIAMGMYLMNGYSVVKEQPIHRYVKRKTGKGLSVVLHLLYDTGFIPQYGQQLLTLSTCYGAAKSDRIIVVAAEKAVA